MLPLYAQSAYLASLTALCRHKIFKKTIVNFTDGLFDGCQMSNAVRLLAAKT